MKTYILLVILFLLSGCTPQTPVVSNPPTTSTLPTQQPSEKVTVDIPVESLEKSQTKQGDNIISTVPKIPESNLSITSSAFNESLVLDQKYTCRGENINPPFTIANVPPKTQSLLLVMSSNTGDEGKYVHWAIWNIDPSITEIKEGELPQGAIQGITNKETFAYEGPCREKKPDTVYSVELYAFSKKLQTNPELTPGHLILEGIRDITGKTSLNVRVE